MSMSVSKAHNVAKNHLVAIKIITRITVKENNNNTTLIIFTGCCLSLKRCTCVIKVQEGHLGHRQVGVGQHAPLSAHLQL